MPSNEFQDRRSPNLDLPLPSPGNQLRQDVLRLIEAINSLDSQFRNEFIRLLVNAPDLQGAREALGVVFGSAPGNVLTAPSFGLGAKSGVEAQHSRTPDNKTLESGLYHYEGVGSGLGTDVAFLNLTSSIEGKSAQLSLTYLPDGAGQRISARTLVGSVWTQIGSMTFKGHTIPLDTAAPSAQRPVLYAAQMGKGSDRGAMEVREAEKVAATQDSSDYAPRILFNWKDVSLAGLAMYANGRLTFEGSSGIDSNGPVGVRSYDSEALPPATDNSSRLISKNSPTGNRLLYSDGRFWRDSVTETDGQGSFYATQIDYEYDVLTGLPSRMVESFAGSSNQRITTYTYQGSTGLPLTEVTEYLGVRVTNSFEYTGTVLTRQTTNRALIG